MELKTAIADKIKAYKGPKEYFVKRLAEGISTIAAAFDPKTSDSEAFRFQI